MSRYRSLLSFHLAVVLLGFLALAGCVPTGERPELVDEHLDELPPAASPACPSPTDTFERFSAAEITVVSADGSASRRCVLIADTAELRSHGLMEVTDLAGYDGMLFSFPGTVRRSFWMGNTVLPLTIAFIDQDGGVVSTADMEPCPEAVDCPDYPPEGPYRWALEVEQGQLDEFGLTDGARLDPDTLPLARDSGPPPDEVETVPR
ncbi:MAG: DUF192 domain-containing protein [Acidimicrobiales bacterium]